MLDWLGDEGERLQRAFRTVIGPTCRPFGKRSTQRGGVSDGNEGVQWNAGYDPRTGLRWLGVNLEGMRYDGWPIARLVTRELRTPTLPGLADEVADAARIEVRMTRDYWQATARPEIVERMIVPTPVPLSALTEERWRQVLQGALACLDPSRNRRGRAMQEVTLAVSGERRKGPVSPHLTFVLPKEADVSWVDFLARAKPRMQTLYDWTLGTAA